MPNPIFLTVAEVADHLRVSDDTIHRWVNNHTLAALRVPSGRRTVVRISAVALEEFINQASSHAGLSDDTAELLDYLTRRDAERIGDLCPRCSRFAIDTGSKFGWCIKCTTERLIELDEAAARERARKLRWWTANGEAWRAERKAKQRETTSA